jgi:hypothetical protein
MTRFCIKKKWKISENEKKWIRKNDGKKWISGESEDESAFLVLMFIFSEQQSCREFHGLSEHILIFLKMWIYSNDIVKIPSLTIFLPGG